MKKIELRMKRFAPTLVLFATLLFAAGCAHDLTAPLSNVPVTSMADYFWTGASPINFMDDSGAHPTMDLITFKDSGNFLLALDADKNGSLRTTIACTVSADTVFAGNFVPGCVLDLDNGWYFTPLDTIALTPHVLSAAVATPDSIFVATDSGVWCASSASGRFTYKGLGNVSDIDAMAATEGDTIFAATRSGQIWELDARNSTSITWTKFSTAMPASGAITSLSCDLGLLYVVIGGNVYQVPKHNNSWTQVSFPSTEQVTSIRANVNLDGTSYLLVGGSGGTIMGYPVAGGTGVKFQQSLQSSGAIHDMAGASSSLLAAATDNGIYEGAQTGSFLQAPTLKSDKQNSSLIFDPYGSAMYFTSGGNVYSAPSSGGTIGDPTTLTKFYDGAPMKLLNEGENSYLLTNTSLYQHTSAGWDTVKGFPRSYYPNFEGGLLLLKSNPEIDSSWRAGTLVRLDHQSFAITARLLSRLDSLVVDGKSYSDVLVVRYSHEIASQADITNVPYWVIYYQRGRGPIMFDRVNVGGGAPERRVVSN